jgi:phosphoserine phosphatase RsbU/P
VTLRSRIALIFGLSAAMLMVIVGLSLGLLWLWTENRLDSSFRDTAEAQWGWWLERAATPHEVLVISLAEDNDFSAAIGRGDRDAIGKALKDRLRYGAREGIDRIDVIDRDGLILSSTEAGAGDSPLIAVAAVNQIVERGYPAVNVELGWDGRIWLVVTIRGLHGTLLSAMQDLGRALPRLEIDKDAEMLLFGRDGKLLAATTADFWPYIEPVRRQLAAGRVIRFKAGDREYATIPVAMRNSVGSPVGTLAIVRDRTIVRAERRLIQTTGAVVSLLFLAGTVFCVYGYMRSALDPLAEITRSVRALAAGNLFAAADLGDRSDEIGQIAAAVEVFRSNAVALDRAQIRDKLREAAQYRLIRREMSRLASMFDEPARGELVAELSRIEAAAAELAEGDEPAPATRSPLAAGFKHMADRVTEQHQRLSTLLRERTRDLEIVRQALDERAQLTRLRQELEVAHDLQMASLPAVFPAFPDRRDFDIFAAMQPAREVGGDFYDFALLDGDRLALFIGDASGKGVSAAMFVAMTRALLRSAVARGSPLPDALAIANDTLAIENETHMFATAFVGVIDLSSGRLRYSNAGHNPPYVVRGGSPIPLDGAMGLALGAIEGFEYEQAEFLLRAGDGVLLYSDGVTEAYDADRKLFGDDRLESALTKWGDGSPEAAVRLIRDAVERFASGAEQADDMTLLALRYIGPAARHSQIAA